MKERERERDRERQRDRWDLTNVFKNGPICKSKWLEEVTGERERETERERERQKGFE